MVFYTLKSGPSELTIDFVDVYHYSIFVDVDRIPKVNVTPCSVANNVTLHTTTWMYYYFIYSNLCITLSHSNISLLLRGACCPRGGHGARILNSEHKEPWIQVLSSVKIVFTLFYFLTKSALI